jgi:hypothetical protein
MKEKNITNINIPSVLENPETENKGEKLEKELRGLLENNILSKEKIVEVAGKLNIKVVVLCYRILSEAKKRNDFINYVKQLKKSKIQNESDMKESIFSFLEKIQQKPEKIKPKKEEVPPVVEPVVIAPPETILEEPQKPAKIISQETKSPEIIIPKSPEPNLSGEVETKTPENLPIEEETEVEKETTKSPKKIDWWEVKRETEVMAIEDLDGSMETFEKHVKELGVAKKDVSGHWLWTGDNKKLVFLGDILGDRGMDGIKITSIIGDLAEQAKKKNGQVDFLCGNHDITFIKFLCKDFDDDSIRKKAEIISSQYAGVMELAKFDPDLNSELKKIGPLLNKSEKQKENLLLELNKKIPEIVVNMKNTKEGKTILENMCQIRVAVVHDDTLFCHTDPTTAMVADLTKDGNIAQRVFEINKIFQENLRKVLFKGEKLGDDFKEIEKIYLYTDNRKNFTEQDPIINLAENLYERLDLEMDKLLIEKNIAEWKKENKIKGDYFPDTQKILSEHKNGNKEKAFKLQARLAEKIRKLNPSEDYIKKVRDSGINAIIHGHSPVQERYYDKNDFIIVSPHSLFPADGSNKESGVSTIKTNGRVNLFGKSFREKKLTS